MTLEPDREGGSVMQMTNLGSMLHLVAGLAALAMGLGILLRRPANPRNRAFALLCASLAVWTLAYSLVGHNAAWRPVYLLGSCTGAPLALHFALLLAGASPRLRRWLVATASVPAGRFSTRCEPRSRAR